MRKGDRVPRLVWISPGLGLGAELHRRLSAAVKAGLRGFQLREKISFPRDLLVAARELRELLPGDESLFVVNDRIDVCLAAGLDGVHLAGTSLPTAEVRKILGPHAWIGRSVHDREELDEAVLGGADYLYVSPVFPLNKKGSLAVRPLGIRGLTDFVKAAPIPVYALGGIRKDRMACVLDSGVHGVAVQSAIAAARDPREAVSALLELLG